MAGDRVLDISGFVPRDIIEWHLAIDEPEVEFTVNRDGAEQKVTLRRRSNESAGVHIESAVFDRVKTCDNHCDFCFIYQLPKGLRTSLYLKDDDYRLSFLYGNFTTLTRFTESDLERVIEERLSPLNVSVHSMQPHLRASMLRNERGAVSLRWMRELLRRGIEIRAQIVLCPGVNDREQLDRTLAMVLNSCTDLHSIAVVPLGLSRFNPESHLRVHSNEEAATVIDQVEKWRDIFRTATGRPIVFAADEFYLLAERVFPSADEYGEFEMFEDGIGMMRSLEFEYNNADGHDREAKHEFFRAADSVHRYGDDYTINPAGETGLRRAPNHGTGPDFEVRKRRWIVTGEYGAKVLSLLVPEMPDGLNVLAVKNEFFGGNTAVTGLITGSDIRRVLTQIPVGDQVFLPDVCLSNGRFLDGMTLNDLERDIHVVPTDGRALRRIVEG